MLDEILNDYMRLYSLGCDSREAIQELLIRAWNESRENGRQVIRDLLSSMDMQEKRESGDFHITVETAKKIWDESKAAALEYLKEP